MRTRRTSLTVVAVVGALVAAGAAAAPATAGTAKRQVAHTKPSWVAHTKSLGTARSTARSTFTVYLAPRGGADSLKAAVARISDPRSASYQHYLSAGQFHAQFDPSASALASVTRWLKSQHLSVGAVSPHNRSVAVSGSNAAVARAFSTQIKTFRHSGRTVQANTTALTVPAAIASQVSSISGLDTTPHFVTHNASKYPDGFRNATPCSTSYGEKKATTLPKFNGNTLPYAVCGYTGKQYRGAYEGAKASKFDGSGVTVAITDAYASPSIVQDASTYAGRNGDRVYAKGQLTQSLLKKYTHKKECDQTGWYGEETLDVEAVHAMAQGADIAYYASASCYDQDFLATLQRVADDNKASIVTNSWGEPELDSDPTLATQYQQVYLQGATQGISFLFSSGDNGDEVANTGTKQADSEANDPYVTAVGGTADAINASNKFAFQTGWGTKKYTLNATKDGWDPVGYLYGAGGGVSTRWGQPAYQKGVVPAEFSSGRAVPDVAMDADPTTGMLVGETQSFPEGDKYGEYRIGGTSLASPLFAGLTALRQEKAGPGVKNRLGFLNPSIYANRATFTDINGNPGDEGNIRVDYANGLDATAGLLYSVRTFNQDASLATTAGWDEVTGVGAGNPSWITAGQ